MEQTNGSAAVSVLKVFSGTSGGLGGPLFSGCVEIKARSLCRKVLVSHGRTEVNRKYSSSGRRKRKQMTVKRTDGCVENAIILS